MPGSRRPSGSGSPGRPPDRRRSHPQPAARSSSRGGPSRRDHACSNDTAAAGTAVFRPVARSASVSRDGPTRARREREGTAMAGKFELWTDKGGDWRFNLKASNGQVIATSQGYSSKAGALNGIESVRTNAPGAPVVEIEK